MGLLSHSPAGRGLSQGLARFAAECATLEIPDEALAAAHRAIIDTAGVTIAGRNEAPVAQLSTILGSGDEARSLAAGCRLRAEDSALLDGLASHVLDYDDVAMHGHPSVVIVPALLAEAQRIGASGMAVLRAYVIGFEAWAEIAGREPDPYHLGSWHPTPMIGILAATTALAALTEMEAGTTRHALGLAASFASGVIANFGSAAKPLHAGRAAAGAVQAIRLASGGFTSSADAVDGPHGLLSGMSPCGNINLSEPVRLGSGAWQLLEQGLSVKRYPVCYASHRAIDGLLMIARNAGLHAAQVQTVTVRLGRAPAATLRYTSPTSGAEARFSMNHNIAAALIDGAVGFAQLSDDYVRCEDVAALYRLTSMEIEDEESSDQPGMAAFDRVVVDIHDGRRLDSGPIRYPRGHARLPLDDAEIDAKFLDCARHGRLPEPERLLANLRSLAEVPNLATAVFG